MERPGGTRALDKQIAAIIGWTELAEVNGPIDLFGKPPGESIKVEPVPFYSSVKLLASWAAEAFRAQGGNLEEPLPSEPWLVCERIIEANNRQTANQSER